MKLFAISLIVALLTIPNHFTHQGTPVVEPKFNPTGYFFLAHRPPRGFADFGWISLSTAEWKEGRWVSISPKGWVGIGVVPGGNFPTLRQLYHMKLIRLTRGRISFETESIKGTKYSFTGRFLRHSVYDETEPKGKVLQGRLVKLRSGSLIAQASVAFTYFRGD